jgi:hypothetical protein
MKKKIPADVIQDWSLQITRADNGYYLAGSAGEKFVIEEKEDDELYEHEQLLFLVQEYFDFQGSKHKERIQILRQLKEE